MLFNQPLLLNFLGGPEVILIFIAIIYLFGPKKIPELARGFGRFMRQIKDAKENVMTEIRKGGLEADDAKETFHKQFQDTTKEITDIKKQVEEEFKSVNNTISRTK